MEDEVGIPLKDRQEIISKIFGRDGLTEATDVDVFDVRVARLPMLIDEKDSTTSEKRFRTYFDNKLLPLLEALVIKPIQRGKVPVNWKNNNSESANHILKSAISWKARDMPKFIEMFYDIVNGEQIERGRAIRDKGNFKLSNAFRHHLIDIDHLSNISEEQRERRMKKFLSDKGRSNPNMIISTDGTRSCLYTPSARKKNNIRAKGYGQKSQGPLQLSGH